MKHPQTPAALIALLTLTPTTTHALDFAWDGDRPSNNWNAVALGIPQATNWNFELGLIPNNDDTVTFPGTAADFIVNLNGNRNVISAAFTGTQPYTLNSDTLTLNSGVITTTGTATHTINSNVAFTTNANITIDAGSGLTINGALSGTGDLEKTGDGTLTLANPTSAITGELTLTSGIVQITEPLQTGGLTVADTTTLDGHAPDMPPVGDAQPGQALTVNGNVSLVGSGLVDLKGANGLNHDASLGDGDGKPGANGGSLKATGTNLLLSDTSRILLQGGNGGSTANADNGHGASGADGGTFTATVTTFSLSNSARINLKGGNGGISGEENGDGGNGRNGGSFTANTTTLTMTNGSQIRLDGGNGGDAVDRGGRGGNAGSFTTSATTITLSDSTDIDLSGGLGADSLFFGDSGRGGNAGVFSAPAATTIDLTGSASIDLAGADAGHTFEGLGGNGGNGGTFSTPAATTINLTGSASIDLAGADAGESGGTGGNGGNGGTFSAPTASSITLADTTQINLSGGKGGESTDAAAGNAGNAGQFNGGDGQLTLSGSASLALNGGNASIGDAPSTNNTGTDAGSLIGTFDLDLSGSSSLSMRGGDGRTKIAIQSGGDGGSINLTDARSMTLSDTATVNLSGGRANDANPGASAGHAGAITIDTGGSLTVQDDALLTSNGGPATDNGVISGNGGSLTLASGTVTIDGGTVLLRKGTTTASAVPGTNGHVTTTGGTFLITNGGSVQTDQFNHITGDATPTINLDGQLTVHDQTLLGSTTNPLVIDGGKLLTDKLSHDTGTTPTLQISDPTGGDPALTVGINNGDSTFQGTIQDADTPGSLTKNGSGTLTLNAANTHTGTTTIDAGVLALADTNALQNSTVQINTNDGLDITTHAVNANLGALSGNGNLNIASQNITIGFNGNDTTYSGTLQGLGGSLTKNGAGTQTLAGGLLYTGPTMVDQGTLQVQGTIAQPAGDITIQPAATLQATGHIQRNLAGTGTVAAVGPLVLGDITSTAGYQFLGTLDVQTHHVILLDADLAQLGPQTQLDSNANLNAPNGALLPTGNTVSVTGHATITGPFTNSGTVDVAAAQSLTFNDPTNGDGNFPGTGEVIFNQGFSPGLSPAVIAFGGNLTFGPFSSLNIETYATTTTPVAGTDHDQLTVANNLTLDGTLNVIPLPDAGPFEDTLPGALGNEYLAITYGTRTPNSFFHTITGTLINTAFALAPILDDTTQTFTLEAAIPGDLNLDQRVSVSDLSEFALNFNTTPGLYNELTNENSWQLGDFNADGAITVADLSLLALNFGFDLDTATPATPLSLSQIATLAGLDHTTIPGAGVPVPGVPVPGVPVPGVTDPGVPEPYSITALILISLTQTTKRRTNPTHQLHHHTQPFAKQTSK